MTQTTYSEYLLLQKGEPPPRDPHASGVRVYADTNGDLRSVQSDGTDAAIGGGLPAGITIQTGAAAPVGSVTPSGVGGLYIETTNGSLFIAIGATSSDWVCIGGKSVSVGISTYLSGGQKAMQMLSDSTGASISDIAAANNSGNGIFWLFHGGDGNQSMQVITGTNGAHTTEVDAAGTFIAGDGGVKFPTSDPHIAGAWWDNAGTLTRSSG